MSEINAESTTMPPVELRMPRASEREEMLAGEGAVVRKGKKTFHRFVAAK